MSSKRVEIVALNTHTSQMMTVDDMADGADDLESALRLDGFDHFTVTEYDSSTKVIYSKYRTSYHQNGVRRRFKELQCDSAVHLLEHYALLGGDQI
jgi:hypothetical protein